MPKGAAFHMVTAPKTTMTMDSRFDTSQWGKEARSPPSPLNEEEEKVQSEEGEDELTQKGDRVVQPLSKSELESFEKKEKKKGIIYISRIPHGMTVAKVRHLLSGFGEVDRIFLQDGREKETGEKRTGRQSKSAHFTEGWVEFNDRKVAKAVAEMLNAEPIGAASGGSGGGKGGKKSGGLGARRWRDEIWTMKYLSGFKWGMLGEQLANERASRASRVRAELSQSAYEQKDYLRKVERARVMRDKDERKRAREAKTGIVSQDATKARERTFKQRETIVRDVREQREKRSSNNTADTPTTSKRLKSSHEEGNSQALAGALAKIF